MSHSIGVLTMDEQTTFKGNEARVGKQLFTDGGGLFLTCNPGQFHGIQSGGPADANFTGCPHKCIAGRYVHGVMQNRLETACMSCPLAMTCPSEGMGNPKICPAGRYGEAEELTKEGCSGKCSPGYYCPEGSTNSTAVACPSGSSPQESELQAAENCTICLKASTVLLQQQINALPGRPLRQCYRS